MQSEHSGLCPDYEQSCSINNPINIDFNPISIGFMNTSVSCVGFLNRVSVTNFPNGLFEQVLGSMQFARRCSIVKCSFAAK